MFISNAINFYAPIYFLFIFYFIILRKFASNENMIHLIKPFGESNNKLWAANRLAHIAYNFQFDLDILNRAVHILQIAVAHLNIKKAFVSVTLFKITHYVRTRLSRVYELCSQIVPKIYQRKKERRKRKEKQTAKKKNNPIAYIYQAIYNIASHFAQNQLDSRRSLTS